MSMARIKLKGLLLVTIGPRCDLCAERPATDLHELLLERDEANSSPALLKLALESWQNVTVLCNPCNIGPAKERGRRDQLIAKAILRAGERSLLFQRSAFEPGLARNLLRILYGANQLEVWLASLPMKDCKPYIRRVDRIARTLMQEAHDNQL